MDALGKLLKTMMWDNVDAEDCQEMFNVSMAVAHSDPNNTPSFALSYVTPNPTRLLPRTASILTHPLQYTGPVCLEAVGGEGGT